MAQQQGQSSGTDCKSFMCRWIFCLWKNEMACFINMLSQICSMYFLSYVVECCLNLFLLCNATLTYFGVVHQCVFSPKNLDHWLQSCAPWGTKGHRDHGEEPGTQRRCLLVWLGWSAMGWLSPTFLLSAVHSGCPWHTCRSCWW